MFSREPDESEVTQVLLYALVSPVRFLKVPHTARVSKSSHEHSVAGSGQRNSTIGGDPAAPFKTDVWSPKVCKLGACGAPGPNQYGFLNTK
jgi:hypothetical protein